MLAYTDFRKAGISADMRKKNLSNCNFSSMVLNDVDFTDSHMGSANFNFCTIKNCQFVNTSMNYATFDCTKLENTELGEISSDIDFSSAVLKNCTSRGRVIKDLRFVKNEILNVTPYGDNKMLNTLSLVFEDGTNQIIAGNIAMSSYGWLTSNIPLERELKKHLKKALDWVKWASK